MHHGHSSSEFSCSLTVYSSVFVGKPSLESCDKIILPEIYLPQLHRFLLAGVLTLELTNTAIGKKTHCGVLEFSSEANVAYLPRWMMHNLVVDDGATVRVRQKSLPKVTFVQFQPHTSHFAEVVSNPKAALEYCLRAFTTLSLNDQIAIEYNGESFLLNVTQLKPSPAVCVVGAEFEVDFAPPLIETAPLSYTALSAAKPATARKVEGGNYAYFTVDATGYSSDLVVRLGCINGDPDVYVSHTSSKPSQTDHALSNTSTLRVKEVLVPLSMVASCSILYIGVTALKGSAEFDISLLPVLEGVDGFKTTAGASLGGVRVGDAEAVAPGGDVKLCETCGQAVPLRTLAMHEAFCARNNWKCPICSVVVRKHQREDHWHCEEVDCGEVVGRSERDKHQALRHSPSRCRCGVDLKPSEVAVHDAELCVLRPMSCRYCDISVPFKDLLDHQTYCGSRTVPCDICGKSVVIKRLDVHKAVDHNINPSKLDRDSVIKKLGTASAPLHPSAPPPPPELPPADFGCPHCNMRYAEWDDLQVHLLISEACSIKHLLGVTGQAGGSDAPRGLAPGFESTVTGSLAALTASLVDEMRLGRPGGAGTSAPLATTDRVALRKQAKKDRKAARRRLRGSGGSDRVDIVEDEDPLICVDCEFAAEDLEELQLHSFTTCPKAADNAARL